MSDRSTDLASKLLEQHVKHELAALKGAKLRKFFEREVSELLEHAESLTLNRLSSVDRVMGVIQRVVVDMELDAGIAELAAETATAVANAPVQQETTLGDIVNRDQASGVVEELLQLRQQRERMIGEMMAHPVYQELVSSLVYTGLVNYLYEDNLLAKSVPGVGSMMKFGKKMANREVPGLDETFERRIKAWLSDSLPGLIARSEHFLNQALTDDEIRDSVMTAWEALEGRTLAELQEGLGDGEMHAFVGLGYEFWLHFRHTAYFEGCARAVVDHLFAKYGGEPIAVLLADLGVTRELILEELNAHVVPIMDVLREEGYVEAVVRRRLSSFYHSAATRKLLDANG